MKKNIIFVAITVVIVGVLIVLDGVYGAASEPSITSISPTSGPVGTMITVSGEHLGADCSGQGTKTCHATLYVGDGAIESENFITNDVTWTDSAISFKIPNSATTGAVKVYRRFIQNWGEEGAYVEILNLKGPVFTLTNSAGVALPKPADILIDPLVLKLKRRISELEAKVVELEKRLVKQIDEQLSNRVKGKILLQVENNGEAWYVEPDSKNKFYLQNGQAAYDMMRSFGLGISNSDLAKIPVGVADSNDAVMDSDSIVDDNLVKRLKGKIVLQVEDNGEAWYINPGDNKRYYLGDPDMAFQLMRNMSLGIKNDDLRKIQVGEFTE